MSPVDLSRTQAAPFPSVEAVVVQWHPYEKGINYFHAKTANPRLEFWGLQIDLAMPGIYIVVRGGENNDVLTNTRSTKVSSFVKDNELAAGLNAVPFDVISHREGRPIKNIGVVISNGELIAPVHSRFDALVFYTDGTAAIVNQTEIESIENIKNAIGGFFQILADGEPVERVLNLEARHPRSAAGISEDGRYLYLLAIDGRRVGSIGSTEKETALLLRTLGSWEGINFDGGGSTALVMRYPDGRVRAVNVPIHKQVPRMQRAVAGCIGVRFCTITGCNHDYDFLDDDFTNEEQISEDLENDESIIINMINIEHTEELEIINEE